MTTAYSLDGILRRAVMASGASVSSRIAVPRNSTAMTVFTPATFAGVNWKLQSLSPIGPQETEVWNDAYTFAPTGVGVGGFGVIQLTFPSTANQALTFPLAMFGGGNLRISTYEDLQSADVVWTVLFAGFNN